jgi:hypothetical protein
MVPGRVLRMGSKLRVWTKPRAPAPGSPGGLAVACVLSITALTREQNTGRHGRAGPG